MNNSSAATVSTWASDQDFALCFGIFLTGSLVLAVFLVDGWWPVARSTVALFFISLALASFVLGLGCLRSIIFSFNHDRPDLLMDAVSSIACIHGFIVLFAFGWWCSPEPLENVIVAWRNFVLVGNGS